MTAAWPPRAALPRPRLLGLLDAVGAPAVAVVGGPAGAGKTTVLLDWLAHLPDTCRTVHVALDGSGTARLRTSAALDLDPGAGLSLSSAAALLERAAGAHLLDGATVVLDGLDAGAGARVRRRLLRAVAPARSHGRLILAGRTLPRAAELERFEPRGRTVITAADLRLTSAETAELGRQRGLRLLPAELRRLYAITGGWAAGVAVAIEILLRDPYDTRHALDDVLRTGAGLDAYLDRDVLADLPAEARAATRAAGILTSCNAELFGAVTGRRDGAAVLDALARQGRLIPLGAGTGWFVMPRLWRAALHHGMLVDAPDRLAGLHLAAARWYAGHGRPAEARRHVAATGGASPARPGPPPDPPPGGAALGRAWLALQAGDPVAAMGLLAAAALAAAAQAAAQPSAARIRALAECQLGRLGAAARTAAAVRADLHGAGVADSPEEAWALLALAAVAVLQGRPARAHALLDDLLVQHWPAHPDLYAGEAFHRLLADYHHGRVAAALAALEALIAEDADPLIVPAWAPRAARIELLLAHGRPGDARRRLDDDAGRFPPIVAALATARAAVADPRARDRDRTVERVLEPFLELEAPALPHAVEAYLLLATAARRAGDDGRARRCHHAAVTLAAPESLRSPFIRLAHIADDAPGPVLTDAEISVLRLLVGFLTVAEIADLLHLSANTVKTHIAAIYHKLGVHRRRDAVRQARQRNLLP
ncbi:LuxR C-terminal-related transcriptional regulator [Dactylosporangium sp. CS-033363]|uniref:helix-turn-helix transcriptional regulator n=1 Tax=Dactylosporangium sp. CS-033363 TaxID=3239935 RepID=UPI003D919A7B